MKNLRESRRSMSINKKRHIDRDYIVKKKIIQFAICEITCEKNNIINIRIFYQ